MAAQDSEPPTAASHAARGLPIRNVCIVAHINAGKTTLTERILFDAGRQRHCGDVESGTATMDWLAEERERGISIGAGVSRIHWRGASVQVVDTPGHVDFSAEVNRCLGVADGAVVVVDAVRGVEPQTEAVWRALDRVGLPRLVFVNKLDRVTADFPATLAALRSGFPGVVFVPLILPWPERGAACALIDAVGGAVHAWAATEPPAAERLRAVREVLEEAAADLDDAVMRQYCAGEPVEARRLVGALRRGVLERRLVPVLAGSALDNRGVEPLLDAVRAFLPGPADREAHGLAPDPAGPLTGLVFQSSPAPAGGGGEVLLRIYRGTLEVGSEVAADGGTPFRVEELFEPHGASREPLCRAGPGEIVALTTPHVLRSGATLAAPGVTAEIEPPPFPAPVLVVRLEPLQSADLEPLVACARRLAAVDPTLEVRFEAAAGTLDIAGMGELHLDVFVERLRRVHGDAVRVGRPAVQLYQTVNEEASGRAACERRLGASRALRVVAAVQVGPRARLGPPLLRWALPDTVAARLAPELREPIAAEVLTALDGALAAPPRGAVLTLLDLELDGDAEMVPPLAVEAILLAARRAWSAAGPRLVEPWVDLDVRVPPESAGAVVADLRARGADVRQVHSAWAATELRCALPMERVLGYATRLRSLTRGKGEFTLAAAGLRPRGGPGDLKKTADAP